jgi:hypothetical protein
MIALPRITESHNLSRFHFEAGGITRPTPPAISRAWR